MAKDQKMQMPGVFGGLMRYDSEYKSKIQFSPTAVIVFVVLIILFVIAIKVFFPVQQILSTGNIPVTPGGFMIPLLNSLSGIL
jgi:preprotein translocase subunit Sec61beta